MLQANLQAKHSLSLLTWHFKQLAKEDPGEKGDLWETEDRARTIAAVSDRCLRFRYQLMGSLFQFLDATFPANQEIQLSSYSDLKDYIAMDFNSTDGTKLSTRVDTRKDMQLVEKERAQW